MSYSKRLMVPPRPRCALLLAALLIAIQPLLPAGAEPAPDAATRVPRAERAVALMPAGHAGAVELVSGEREVTTYRATRDTPVMIELYGPTEVTLTSRLEFTPALRGDQRYVLDVRSNDASLIAVTFRARRSDVTTYRRPSRSGRVPGVADRVRVRVPSGLHRYFIRARGTSAPGILVLPTIPARDVNRGEGVRGNDARAERGRRVSTRGRSTPGTVALSSSHPA